MSVYVHFKPLHAIRYEEKEKAFQKATQRFRQQYSSANIELVQRRVAMIQEGKRMGASPPFMAGRGNSPDGGSTNTDTNTDAMRRIHELEAQNDALRTENASKSLLIARYQQWFVRRWRAMSGEQLDYRRCQRRAGA